MKKEITKKEPNKKKVKTVEMLKELIKSKKTMLIASIKNISGSQFQEIVKKIRGKAVVKVPKKNLIFKSLDESGKGAVEKIKSKINDSVAILFSDLDSFELAGELISSRSPSKAKAGQIAPEDIEIPAGPTELVPGPAISELGSLGIKIQIDKGKITIKEPKVIAKSGEKISQNAADLMSKLDIKPFSIGFIPLCAYDSQENKFYDEINIDKEKTLEELKYAFGKALPFAISISYTSNETIKFLLGKSQSHARALENLKPVEEKKSVEEPKEETSEEKISETQNQENPREEK